MSPNKHQLRGPAGNYVRFSEEAPKQEERIISESKAKIREVESDKKDSDFECSNKSDGKPVYVDVDKEITGSSQKDPTLAFVPNRSEKEEINNNGETGGENGNADVRRSNRTFKPAQQLCSVPCFWIRYKEKFICRTNPISTPWSKLRLMTTAEIDLDYDPMEEK